MLRESVILQIFILHKTYCSASLIPFSRGLCSLIVSGEEGGVQNLRGGDAAQPFSKVVSLEFLRELGADEGVSFLKCLLISSTGLLGGVALLSLLPAITGMRGEMAVVPWPQGLTQELLTLLSRTSVFFNMLA